MHQRTLHIISNDGLWPAITADLFRQFKYNVLTFSTCVESFEVARRARPDCVLIDSCIQEMEGGNLAKWIRADPDLRKTPILIASGDTDTELKTCFSSGIDGFFLKSWPSEKVFVIVENLLRRVDWERGIITHNDLHLDGTNCQVFRNSKPVAKLSKEQFYFLYLLIEKTPRFVREADIARYVFKSAGEENKKDIIRGLAQRLRIKLRPQLGRRIKTKVSEGWVYLAPRRRSDKSASLPSNLSLAAK